MAEVVMIPCPEEHVPELTLIIMRMSMGMGIWAGDAVPPFVASLAADGRRLVDEVARRAVGTERLPYSAAATILGVTVGEVLDLVTDVNDQCIRAGLTPLLITDTARQERGDTTIALPVLAMVRPVAERILSFGIPDGDGSAAPT